MNQPLPIMIAKFENEPQTLVSFQMEEAVEPHLAVRFNLELAFSGASKLGSIRVKLQPRSREIILMISPPALIADVRALVVELANRLGYRAEILEVPFDNLPVRVKYFRAGRRSQNVILRLPYELTEHGYMHIVPSLVMMAQTVSGADGLVTQLLICHRRESRYIELPLTWDVLEGWAHWLGIKLELELDEPSNEDMSDLVRMQPLRIYPH